MTNCLLVVLSLIHSGEYFLPATISVLSVPLAILRPPAVFPTRPKTLSTCACSPRMVVPLVDALGLQLCRFQIK